MKNKRLASGFEVPILGIGTYGMGGEHSADNQMKHSLWTKIIPKTKNLNTT